MAMKKTLTVIAALVLFSSCSKGPTTDCIHKWGKWHETKVTNIMRTLLQERTCEKCGINQYTEPLQP